jgi:iron only hydrogenase large subunit-like protein
LHFFGLKPCKNAIFKEVVQKLKFPNNYNEGDKMSHHQPDPNKSVNLIIDGKPVTVPEGTRILEAAKKVNVNIPTLCEHPELCKRALCRICVVEADGRGKLIAACANDVWEGVSIVTINQRLLNIRKTIIELILANHPQDCLSCIRNKKCELQSLALSFGVGANASSSLFENDAEERQPLIESETLVRNMDKCVKCGRCVEFCQEVQTIRAINTSHRSHEYEISTPYKQALKDGTCVFCGGCSAVCPVGAIYGHDQTAEVWTALNDSGRKTVAQVSPSFTAVLNDELSLAEGTVTTGKLITAIKLLGFDKVYDAGLSVNAANFEIEGEIQQSMKNGSAKLQGKNLPVISGCSEGIGNFIKNSYPDLAENLVVDRTSRRRFASLLKAVNGKITAVSFVPCIAQKYGAGVKAENDFALTAGELARMLKLAGIVIEALPEEPFEPQPSQANQRFAGEGSPLDVIGVGSTKQDNSGLTVKKEVVYGFENARKIMEAIRKGECDAQWVEIYSCPGSCHVES